MIVGVPRETFPGERRVALVPVVIPNLSKVGIEVVIEAGAGVEAGFPDAEYAAKGAKVLNSRAEVFGAADIVIQVRGLMEIIYTPRAAEDLKYWKKSGNKGVQAKIIQLIGDIEKHPFEGIGKPEPLKHNLSGAWSRRITHEHRLVYEVNDKNNEDNEDP